MSTLDDICETFDDFVLPGDTPIRFKFDTQFFTVASITAEKDGTVTIELEEDDESARPAHHSPGAPIDPSRVGIHWGDDGL